MVKNSKYWFVKLEQIRNKIVKCPACKSTLEKSKDRPSVGSWCNKCGASEIPSTSKDAIRWMDKKRKVYIIK